MAQRGRPRKQPVATRIEDALDAAQTEIDQKMPKDVQNALVPLVAAPVVVAEPPVRITKDAQDDYEFARTNLHNLLMKGNEVLEGITELAESSEHPRTYEVAGTILKVLIDGTRELLQLQKDMHDLQKKTVAAQDPNTPVTIERADQVNNVVVEATTMEMLDFLNNQRQKKSLDQGTVIDAKP